MKPLVARGDGTAQVDLAEGREAGPDCGEAVVEQRAISLNRGETRALGATRPGKVFGWDVAGIVAQAAADGSGPPAGARVIGVVGGGGWAQRVAVPARNLAVIPDGLGFALASVLPTAGLLSLWTLSVSARMLGLPF